MDFEAQAATDIPEDQLARWLFTEYPMCRSIARELRPPTDWSPFFKVSTERLVPEARGPGDVDVLVSSAQTPEHSIAIEVKRIKVARHTFYTGSPGKLGNLAHGVQQANLLHQLGFHRTYLLLAVVADGRERVDVNFAFRGLTPDLLKTIYEFRGRDELASRVGLLVVEATQPVDKEINSASAIIVNEARPADAQKQPLALSQAITALFREERREGNKG